MQASTGSGGGKTSVTVPPMLQAPLGTMAGEVGTSLNQLPTPAGYINNYPLQGVAPLTGAQTSDINAEQGLATNPFALNPQEQSAANTYGQLSQGANPAVAYGQNVFNQMVAPTVESQSALSGMANSGAEGENLAMAGEQMALPMAQQGYNMEATGAAGMAGLGGQSYNQGITNLSTALQAAGIPQQEAQAILNAQYQQQQGQTGAGLSFESQIANWLPSLLGSSSTNVNTGFGLGL